MRSSTVKISTSGDHDVVVTRLFDAPRLLVFDALTTPDLLGRWYAPPGWALLVCDVDLRVGGRWRFVLRRPDGKEIGQRGEYREIVRPERLVKTESWEDWDPGETLVTTVLTQAGGTTTLTTTSTFPSKEVRDIVVKAGLERNVGPMYDKLAALLLSLSPHESREGGANA